MDIHFEMIEGNGTIEVIGDAMDLPARSEVSGKLMIRIPLEEMKGRKTPFKLGVYDSDNKLIEEFESSFMGPIL